MVNGSAIGKVNNAETGWRFCGKYDEPGYGYVLSDLQHDNHPFARELRVERILIATHPIPGINKPHNFENFTLGTEVQTPDGATLATGWSPKLKRIKGPETVILPMTSKGPLGHYTPRFAVTTTYKIEKLFGEENQELILEHTTLFTPYSKNTSHEPAGILKEARIYPLIKFHSPAISNDKPLSNPFNRIASIRVIYRMEFTLSGSRAENQAGIWKDRDVLGDLAAVSEQGTAAFAFVAAEKPLVIEVVGRGVTGSSSFIHDKPDWDNFHQWNGGFKNVQEFKSAYNRGGQMPPSPGLPYGVHQHWRWSTAAYEGVFGLLEGGKQFGGVSGAGGPLIDPRIPDQELQFAVTIEGKHESTVRSQLDSKRMFFGYPFLSLFKPRTTPPKPIWQGGRLATWVDILAHSRFVQEEHPFESSMKNVFEGTLFAHGIGFAHEDEDVMPLLTTVPGAYKPQFIPAQPPNKWRRP